MNNKFACSLVLFFTLPLIASEVQKNIFDEKISMIISMKYKSNREGQVDRCVIIGKHDQLTIDDVSEKNGLLLNSKSEFNINRVVRKRDGSFQVIGSSLMLSGISMQDFNAVAYIENKDGDVFQQRIKQCYDVYKANPMYTLRPNEDPFFVHLEKANPIDKKIISLRLTEDQVKQILQKPSAMRPILAFLGAAGFVAFLVYYFGYSKCIALLQRN